MIDKAQGKLGASTIKPSEGDERLVMSKTKIGVGMSCEEIFREESSEVRIAGLRGF